MRHPPLTVGRAGVLSCRAIAAEELETLLSSGCGPVGRRRGLTEPPVIDHRIGFLKIVLASSPAGKMLHRSGGSRFSERASRAALCRWNEPMRPWLARALLCLALTTPLAPRARRRRGRFAAASLKTALDAVQRSGRRRPARSRDLLRGEFGARQADRAGRAGGDVHLGRSRLDGLSGGEEPDQAGYPRQAARQSHRADRTGRQHGDDRRSRRASTLRRLLGNGRLAWPTSTPCRPENTARRRWKSSACGTSVDGKVRRPRTCARRCCWCRAARRRSASSTRRTPLPTRSVKIVGIPRGSHPPIIYPVALTAGSKGDDALAFLKCLQ